MFNEQPAILTHAVGFYKGIFTLEFFAIELYFKRAFFKLIEQVLFLRFFSFYFFYWLVSTFVPNYNCSSSIFSLRNYSFKIAVVKRVVFYHHSEPFVLWVG